MNRLAALAVMALGAAKRCTGLVVRERTSG
jgi:hypothetical protein